MGKVVEANWIKKVEVLKTATNPEISLREIGRQLDVSNGTVWNIVNEFNNIYQLTENETDFPRKLMKYFNVNLPAKVTHLDINDIKQLRHHVERARKRLFYR